MTSQHELLAPRTGRRPPREPTAEHLPEDPQERADVQEDRRRQQDLDHAELGGES
jgi:hypothetical protein